MNENLTQQEINLLNDLSDFRRKIKAAQCIDDLISATLQYKDLFFCADEKIDEKNVLEKLSLRLQTLYFKLYILHKKKPAANQALKIISKIEDDLRYHWRIYPNNNNKRFNPL